MTTDNFAEYCRSSYGTLPSTTDLLKRTTLFGVFSVPRTADTRRVLVLPHPASQLALSRIIADNRKEIKDTIDDTKVSLYDTRARLGISRTFLGLDFELKSTKEAQILSRYPVILKADIQNFFHTIYSHSIPWGVLGKQHVKAVREGNDAAAKRKLESHWSSKIDVAVQRGNSRETFGIPVGPDTSRIISELLLCGIHRSPQLLGMIDEHSAYRLVDDFYIGFDNEAKARECRDALRRTLWDYNLHLNETKTEILRSARVFDSGWKYDINNFVISDASAPKQYEDVERLLDIALRHCEDRRDWLPMVFFCYRILRLDINAQNFNLIRDCMFRV
jgi:hypothetical protein